MSYPIDRVVLFDRDMNPLPELAPSEVYSRERTEEINGEHSLVITTTRLLQEGWRALTVDGTGKWREWVVTEIDESHESGKSAFGTYHFVWSLQYDLTYSYFHDTEEGVSIGMGSDTISATAAEKVLENVPNWTVGYCDAPAIAAGTGCVFVRESAWSKLSKLVECSACEVDAEIEVSPLHGVTSRGLSLREHLGNSEALRRFDWGSDLTSVKRTPDPGPYYCRVVPLGKGEQEYADDDETTYDYPMDITEETGTEENPGPYWIQDDEAAAAFRIRLSDGTYYYPTIAVSYNEDDPELLLNAAMDELHDYTRPGVTYEADVLQLAEAGMDVQGVALGDDVQVVDYGFNPDAALRIQGRVVKVEVDELSPETSTKLTIGQLRDNLADTIGGLRSSLGSLATQTTHLAGTVASFSTERYLRSLIDRLNEEINATGGYGYLVEGEGFITYDVAVSDPLIGSEATQVVQIKGGSIRIANSKKTNFGGINDWNWKTVFTSGHVAADMVTAAQIVSGYIGSGESGNYWNLDTGEFRMAATSTVGGRTVSQLLSQVDSTITGVDVQYAQGDSPTVAPTSGWSTTAPPYEAGKYIWTMTRTTTPRGTSFSTPVMISGRDGTSGLGIESTTISYATSSTAGTTPTNWQSAVPNVPQGNWLWVRTVYVYTDNSEKTTYSKSYVGTDGQDGKSVYIQSSTKVNGVTTIVLTDGTTTSTISIADGEDGSDGQAGESGYVHIAWAESDDGSRGFSTSVSSGKTYIGIYTDNTQADSQDYHDYSWSLIKGADGTGIRSIVEQYYLSTSSSTQTGGSWSTQQPAWSEGHYIWTRSLITWDTTPETTTTTTPVLAQALTGACEGATQAQQAVDEISTQEAIFNLLTNNGVLQGLYMSGGQLYVNASYIQSGTLKVGGANNGNGVIQVVDGTNNVLSQLDNSGISMIMKGYSTGSTHTVKMGIVNGYDISGNSRSYRGLFIETNGESTIDTKLIISATESGYAGGGSSSDSITYYRQSLILADGSLEMRSFNSDTRKYAQMQLGTNYLFLCAADPNSYGSSASLALNGRTARNDMHGSLVVSGNFTVAASYTKSKIASTANYGDRLLYCYETPTPMFGDIGNGKTGADGLCYVSIDDVFAETVNVCANYQVFLQKCGNGDIWVEEKNQSYFVVKGTPNLAFDWEVKAKQRNFETLRLDDNNLNDIIVEEKNVSTPESCYDEDVEYVTTIESLYEDIA